MGLLHHFVNAEELAHRVWAVPGVPARPGSLARNLNSLFCCSFVCSLTAPAEETGSQYHRPNESCLILLSMELHCQSTAAVHQGQQYQPTEMDSPELLHLQGLVPPAHQWKQ